MVKSKNNIVEPILKKRGRKPGSKNKIASTKKNKKPTIFNFFLLVEKEISALNKALKKITTQFQKGIDKLNKNHASELLTQRQKFTKSIAIWKGRSKAKRKISGAKRVPKKTLSKKHLSDKPVGKRGRPAKSKVDISLPVLDVLGYPKAAKVAKPKAAKVIK